MFIDFKKIGEIANHWGDKMPMLVMEEAGELIQAVSKMERATQDSKNGSWTDEEFERYSSAYDNLVEEIRDMYISLHVLQYLYGISDATIEDAINSKIDRKYE